MKELYEKWLARAEQQGKLSKSSISSAKAAFKHCHTLHDTPYKSFMMQDCIVITGGKAIAPKEASKHCGFILIGSLLNLM